MSPEISVIVGTAIGAVIGAGSSICANVISMKSEERKHKSMLYFNFGTENFKQACEMARTQRKGSVPPLELFILHMMKMSNYCNIKNLDIEKAKEIIREMKDFSKDVEDYYKGSRTTS